MIKMALDYSVWLLLFLFGKRRTYELSTDWTFDLPSKLSSMGEISKSNDAAHTS